MLIKTIDNVLTHKECSSIISHINRSNPELATVGNSGEITAIRNNLRVIDNDPYTSTLIFNRIKNLFPPGIIKLNPILRYYKYTKDMYFKPHYDSAVKENNLASEYTVLIYLNENSSGGETIFITEPEISISPKTGKCLMFKHDIMHEGAKIKKGVKYVLRTDAIYPAHLLPLCS